MLGGRGRDDLSMLLELVYMPAIASDVDRARRGGSGSGGGGVEAEEDEVVIATSRGLKNLRASKQEFEWTETKRGVRVQLPGTAAHVMVIASGSVGEEIVGVALKVEDVTAARRFYEDKMGMGVVTGLRGAGVTLMYGMLGARCVRRCWIKCVSATKAAGEFDFALWVY